MMEPGLSFPSVMASHWTLPGSQIGKDDIREKEKAWRVVTYCIILKWLENWSLTTCKLDLQYYSIIAFSLFFFVGKRRTLRQFILCNNMTFTLCYLRIYCLDLLLTKTALHNNNNNTTTHQETFNVEDLQWR